MADTEWQTVHGTFMTSQPIDAYGGLAIPGAVLQDIARQIQEGEIPFHIDHDLSKPLRVRSLEVFVELRPEGYEALVFRAEVHADDVHWVQSRPGMSATLTVPIERDEGAQIVENASLQVSADHAWFGDDGLIEAETYFIDQGLGRDKLRVERALQFGLVPDPQIFITVVYPLLISVGAGAIWDGIKLLFARRRTPKGGVVDAPTVINMTVTDGTRSVTAVVKTTDGAVAKHAIDTIGPTVRDFFNSPIPQSPATTVWDEENHNWPLPG
jgi:hypothetical protein